MSQLVTIFHIVLYENKCFTCAHVLFGINKLQQSFTLLFVDDKKTTII